MRSSGNNVFGGFDRRSLVDSLNIREDLADKIQSRREDQRGKIENVQDNLQLIAPGREDVFPILERLQLTVVRGFLYRVIIRFNRKRKQFNYIFLSTFLKKKYKSVFCIFQYKKLKNKKKIALKGRTLIEVSGRPELKHF